MYIYKSKYIKENHYTLYLKKTIIIKIINIH